MPVKTNQTTHQEAAGKENTLAHSTGPSVEPLTLWPLTGGSERRGSVTGECEMPEAEVILSCSAWEQRLTRLFHDMFSHISRACSGRRLLGMCGSSQVMPELSHTQIHQWQQLWQAGRRREETNISRSNSEHLRPAVLWLSLRCVHEWHCMYMNVWVSGSLSQRPSMRVHVQMCESVMLHVTTSTSLNVEWTNHTVWDDKTKESYEGEPQLKKKRKKNSWNSISTSSSWGQGDQQFHLRLKRSKLDFQHVKTPEA